MQNTEQNQTVRAEQKLKISFTVPDLSDAEINEVVEALRSGWITTGPRTKLLERCLAEYCGVNRGVCLNSATACMELTLRLLGVGPGDEVITSAYTYTATASPIFHCGAKIVFVDTAPDSYEMDYEKMAAAITEKTKAILPVDIGGFCCDYDRIFEIVEQKKSLFHAASPLQEALGRVAVIADCAHALGSTYHGKPAGSVADFSVFSFHAVKNLTTAEGGAVVWKSLPGIDDEEIYHEYQLLSLHGQSKDALTKSQIGKWEYDIISPAYKCNMTDIAAAIGLKQLERYEGLLLRRRELFDRYNRHFAGADILTQRLDNPNGTSNGHLFLTRLPGRTEQQRNRIIERVGEQGIAVNVHFKPLPMMTAYKNLGYSIADFPNAYHQFANEITLPLHTKLSDDDADYIAEQYLAILKE
ncbi:MAG: DegT/DnrJ/EryC1/StrS family aminotransferase [Clostridia bacterium]|nr:DegT/DnrJ/EryC1/StrS family aminotransferase [Clostridia bacterium]